MDYCAENNWRVLLSNKRKELNMTYDEFAKLLKISKSTLMSYEKGSAVPRMETVVNIAELLDMDIYSLVKIIRTSSSYKNIIHTLPCFNIQDVSKLQSFTNPPFIVLTTKLWKNEYKKDLMCIRDEDRMMLFAIKNNRFGKNENVIVEYNKKNKFELAKYTDNIIYSNTSGEVLKNVHIFAQYKRDIKDYILEDNKKTYLPHNISENFIL